MQSLYQILKRWCLLGSLIILLILFYYLGFHHYLTFEAIHTSQLFIKEWTENHAIYAVSLYVLSFSLMIACCIPGASVFTVLGGFLFGNIAIFYSVFSTTFGGLILFLSIRTAFGASIAEKSRGWIKTMEQGFQKNAFLY